MGIFGDYAHKYYEAGYLVLPTYGKRPAFNGWNLPDNLKDIDYLATAYDDANIGVLLGRESGIVAFDFDLDRDGFGDLDAIATASGLFKVLPETAVFKRGKKGVTLFYQFSEDLVNLSMPGVFDFLVSGKQTVLPPSYYYDLIEENNVKKLVKKPEYDYKWAYLSLLDIKPNELPKIEQSHVAKIKYKLAQYELKYEKKTGKKGVGGRNNKLFEITCACLEKQKSVDQIADEIFQFDYINHTPPWFSDELEHTNKKSAHERAVQFVTTTKRNLERRGKLQRLNPPENNTTIEQEFLDLIADAEAGMKYVKYPLAPGILGELVGIIDSAAHRSQPNYVLGAVTALLGVACANKYTCNDVFSNTYNLNVGETGSGKEKPQKIIKNLLLINKKIGWLGESYGSDAAYVDGLKDKLERLDIVDECAALLKESSNPGSNSHFKKMANIMMDLYTKPGSVATGRKTITGGATPPIFSPCVSFLGTTTPNALSDSLSMKDFETGLIPRFNVFFGNKKSELIIFPQRPDYDKISAILKPLFDVTKQRDHNNYPCNFREVKFDQEHFIDLVKKIEREFQKTKGPISTLLTRQIEKVCKYIIFASALENPTTPTASKQIMDWAYELTNIQNHEMAAWLDLKDSSLYNLLYREALSRGKEGITKSELTYRFKNISKKLRDETILELVEDGKLIQCNIKTDNAKKTTNVFYALKQKK